MISGQQKELAEKVIKSHDGKNYAFLKNISLPSPPEDIQNTITQKMYDDMCEDISLELGIVCDVAFIDCLNRKDTQLTLWKVRYSISEYEVFWGISFDRETHKVKDIHVDW